MTPTSQASVRTAVAWVPSVSFAVQHARHDMAASSAAAPRSACALPAAGHGDGERDARDAYDHPGTAGRRGGTACFGRLDPAHHHVVFDRAGDRTVAVWTAVGSVWPPTGAAGWPGIVHLGRCGHRDRTERGRA